MRLAKGGQRQFNLEINSSQIPGITQLQQGTQERIIVQIPIRANIGHLLAALLQPPCGRLIEQVGGRNAVFDVPLAHKILCDKDNELWATI